MPDVTRAVRTWGVAVVLGMAGAVSPGDVEAATPAAAKDEAKVAALLAKFKAIKGLSADYTEEKTMALLAKPLVSTGSIHYARPGVLARHQHTPEKTRVVIRGDTLEYGAAHGNQTVDLESNPIVRLFVDSFLDVLSGDRGQLQRVYRFAFAEQSGGAWTLTLTPKKAPLTKLITAIEIAGKDVILHRVTIREVGGDTTVMTFSKVNPKRRYTKTERAQLFTAEAG